MKNRKLTHIIIAFVIFSFVSTKLVAQGVFRITCGGDTPEAQLNLEAGFYELSLKVWIDSNSSIKGFKTVILPNEKSLNWELTELNKGEWVTLIQEFTLEEKVLDGHFKIQMLEDDDFGVGEGSFYIDDIELVVEDGYKAFDNFNIEVVGETCVDKSNGIINIVANEPFEYIVVINGEQHSFEDQISFEDLSPGVYDVCISIPQVNFEQCFNLEIEAAAVVSGKISIISDKAQIVMNAGTPPFNVQINGEDVLTTNNKEFSIKNIQQNDLIEVKTAIACEGVFSKQFENLEFVQIYPNPAETSIMVSSPLNSTMCLYNSYGKLVLSKAKTQLNTVVDISKLASGIYFLKVYFNTKIVVKKVVVK